MVYISVDQYKIMQQFQEFLIEFFKVFECLKIGNRKVFVGEFEKKLKDLDYIRIVLYIEIEIQKKVNDKGFYLFQVIEKVNELVSVEKFIIEY